MQQESENGIKSFKCSIHASENVQRVSLELNADSSLRCVECILNHPDQTSKDMMIPLNEFLDQAAKQYGILRSLEGPVPSHFIEVLSQEEIHIEKLTHHIEQEKQKIDYAFNTILQEFTQLCLSTKEDIFRQLDEQIFRLSSNYQFFKNNIDRYFHKAGQNDTNPDRSTLQERLNQCADTNEAENLIKNIKEDILEALVSRDPMTEIQNNLNSLSAGLKRQSSVFPKSLFHDDIEPFLKKFRETVNPLIDRFNDINDQFPDYSLTQTASLDSKLLTKVEDLKMLKRWISPSGDSVGFKLLFRATRDGMNAKIFHEKCDKYSPTLTIMKSNFKKICGGFTDCKWSGTTSSYSEKSFLFSIDEKQKFPVRKQTQSIRVERYFGPTFGSDPADLFISFNFGCSSLGKAYEVSSQNSQQNHALLAGAKDFKIEEVEVFYIESISGADLDLPRKA